jgi:hypothetical protein
MCFIEVVVAGAAAMEAPVLRGHAPADEGVLLLVAAQIEVLIHVRSVAA